MRMASLWNSCGAGTSPSKRPCGVCARHRLSLDVLIRSTLRPSPLHTMGISSPAGVGQYSCRICMMPITPSCDAGFWSITPRFTTSDGLHISLEYWWGTCLITLMFSSTGRCLTSILLAMTTILSLRVSQSSAVGKNEPGGNSVGAITSSFSYNENNTNSIELTCNTTVNIYSLHVLCRLLWGKAVTITG